MKGGGIGLKD